MLEIILLILIVISAIIFNHSIVKNNIIKIPSYVPSLVFVILAIPAIILNTKLEIIISLIISTLLYCEIISLYDNNMTKFRVFKTGLFTGLLILLNYDFLFFYILIIFSLIYYKRFDGRNFLIQLLGLTYPLGVVLISLFLEYIDANKYPIGHLISPSYSMITEYPFFIITLCGLLIISFRELYINFYKKKEIAKKGFYILFFICFLTIAHSIYINKIDYVYYLVLPLSLIISNYLIYIKSTKFRTFLLGLLLISFILNFIYV